MKTQIGNTLQFAKIRLFLQSESMFYHKGRAWNLNEIWHLQKCNPLHFLSGTTNVPETCTNVKKLKIIWKIVVVKWFSADVGIFLTNYRIW